MARRLAVLLLVGLLLASGCTFGQPEEPRLSLFVGVDVSGSFAQTPHFKDSLRFLSYYLYGHLNGAGGLQKPRALYVGSIGGDAPNEPKAFYPIQEFQRKSPREIEARLTELFGMRGNFLTDFNAFFQRVGEVVRKQNLILAPITIVIVTDGVFEAAGPRGKAVLPPYEKIDVSGLEYLARNVTIRILYPTPKTAAEWERKVPRQRVRIWPVEAEVMGGWREQIENRSNLADEKRLWKWIRDIVDHRARRQTIL